MKGTVVELMIQEEKRTFRDYQSLVCDCMRGNDYQGRLAVVS